MCRARSSNTAALVKRPSASTSRLDSFRDRHHSQRLASHARSSGLSTAAEPSAMATAASPASASANTSTLCVLRLDANGSVSIRITVRLSVIPVCGAIPPPNTTMRSARVCMAADTGVPDRPSTPVASGCVSGMQPFAGKVVATAASMRSASERIAPDARDPPLPTTKRGFSASLSNSTILVASASASGNGLWTGDAPLATSIWGGSICTSSGITRCATSCCVVA